MVAEVVVNKKITDAQEGPQVNLTQELARAANDYNEILKFNPQLAAQAEKNLVSAFAQAGIPAETAFLVANICRENKKTQDMFCSIH